MECCFDITQSGKRRAMDAPCNICPDRALWSAPITRSGPLSLWMKHSLGKSQQFEIWASGDLTVSGIRKLQMFLSVHMEIVVQDQYEEAARRFRRDEFYFMACG